ncbi:MAG: DUF1893 domain-containing protein [Ruminococcus sp.]|nr:DUF1893 domain-containing protein [Ruminococcus sp.]
MTDIEKAVQNLSGHSICLCHENKIITDDGRGISPMMQFISEEKDLKGWSVADIIVGKAAAMLFVKVGIIAVYGKVMSQSAKTFLESHHITCEWETLTEKIINRAGTDICPMEKTVAEINDIDEAYNALYKKLSDH